MPNILDRAEAIEAGVLDERESAKPPGLEF